MGGNILIKIILKYKMLNLDDIGSNKKTSSSENNIWSFRMFIIGPSGFGKTNTLLHLINNFHPIDKIYLYAKDTDEKQYQFLINKREQAGIKNLNDPHAFIEYSNDMNDALDDINVKILQTANCMINYLLGFLITTKRGLTL